MARHNDTGHKGEALARKFLENKGYRVLETNWRYRRAEIDIIAKDGEILVFVEVKTRSSTAFGRPEEFVSTKKEQFMIDSASAYMEAIGHNWEIRFDIIAVLLPANAAPEVEHFKDAFFPGI
ncbi:MAG: UPF0102 protein [Saprospiraceae bacterium]|nr:MAG: UPF0102 protein [Saprospiraceae bacterium]